MAADGAWTNGAVPEEPDDARTRAAVEQLRGLLGGLEGRLAVPGAGLAPQAASDLAAALQVLARRMGELEGAMAGRYEALSATLRLLAGRLDGEAARNAALEARLAASEARIAARLDHALAELAAVRAARAATAEPEPALIRLILGAAAGAAALSVLGAGAMILAHPEALPRAVATIAAGPALPLRPGLAAEARPAGGVAPLPVKPIIPATGAARESYESVAAALERGEPMALARLTGLAQAGEPRAQMQLAELYETGGAGVPRDLFAARQWTRKAAEGGDRVAMHNLALFLSAGEGGPRDVAEAASWFRRAADRGVIDSQFNLGLIYEAGRGVEKNLREAYRWFAVAANAGDVAAREKQVEIEARLTAAERAGLDREAGGYQPGAGAGPDLAVIIPPAATLAETQALLARQGYYVGPVDGVSSPVLRAATAAYLRDHPGAAARSPGTP